MNTCHNDLKNQLKFLGFEHVEKIFSAMNSNGSEIDMDRLMYFLRPIMMRHSQEQKYRGTTTTLMSLPPKVSNFWHQNFKCAVFATFFSLSNTLIVFAKQFRRSGKS